MYYQLKKPDLSNIEEKNLSKTIFDNELNKEEIFKFIKKTFEPEYLYWDSVQYKEPVPECLSRVELWKLIKIIREAQSLKSIIVDKDGKNFSWLKLPYFEKFFHELDMNTGGELFVRRVDIDRQHKQKMISRGIMEEAIASSQLEGAATSRQVAKQMLRAGRKPRNVSEQMIVNNYRSMKAIEDSIKNKK